MRKLIVMYPQPAVPDSFIEYYLAEHLPKVKQLPGLVSASYGKVEGVDSPYFIVFEALFEDQQALDFAMKSDAGRALAKDIPNYSPGGATMLVTSVESV